jgi:L-threonylcarbamoyladenylate synthase
VYGGMKKPPVGLSAMAEVFDCSESTQLLAAARAARQAIGRGELIVLPTDTVYGVGADAFNPEAVTKLLEAKGRGRQSPPPVLIADLATLGALAAEVNDAVRSLAERCWPGALTMVLTANPSLSWDLGDTGGTVALRMPDLPFTLELLRETGPLAVSSANLTAQPAARTAAAAEHMLGDSVAVYLEAGESTGAGTPSTIIDATRLTSEDGVVRILREGAISRDALVEILAEIAPRALVEG